MKKSLLAFFCVAILSVLGGCKENRNHTVRLDPDHPVSITVWHYYNGTQQTAFDHLLAEFNDTEGKEKGIYVAGYSQGDVANLEASVRSAMNQEAGSAAVPNIFSCYADTAFEMERKGYLTDISQYLSEKELGEYVDSYIEEGCIGSNQELRIFPVAKSTEILMINKTDWEKFAGETGAALEELKTREGLAEVAKEFYEWTDAETPDIPEDGRAFYGRDAMANLFIISSVQLGNEIFQVSNQKATLQADKSTMKRIWDYYYTPYIKGYFKSFGRFRSDDVKIGEIISFTGSTVSSVHFPDDVEKEEESYPIDYLIMPDPVFEGGENYAIQQGGGMVITKATPEEEYASAVFLKWFTREENNIAFGCTSGYLPVLKSANSKMSLDVAIAEKKLEVSPKTYDAIVMSFENLSQRTPYANKAFDGGGAAREVLEYHLQQKADADRISVKERLAEGKNLEEATAEFLTQEAFEEWYQSFCSALEEAIQKN